MNLLQADESDKNIVIRGGQSGDQEAAKINGTSVSAVEALLRFTPAHLSGAPDILVEAPITHPFLVKDKGM